MRVLLRADAGPTQGSGHVMRCLTLGGVLRDRGHAVALAGAVAGIPWLDDVLDAAGIPVLPARRDAMDAAACAEWGADVGVVDSYRIPATDVSAWARDLPALAIVDGGTRGIEAALYLDQNLGAEDRGAPIPAGSRMLAGAAYALVRSDVLAARRVDPWRASSTGRPRLLAVMGGTDATGAIVAVADAVAALGPRVDAILIAGDDHRAIVEERLARTPTAQVIPPTRDLAALYAATDVVVSAAGTSSWEVCTLGLPAVMVAVVDNQVDSLREMVRRGLVEGVDASGDRAALAGIGPALERLVSDEDHRRSLSERSRTLFDGHGARRVAEALESLVSGTAA